MQCPRPNARNAYMYDYVGVTVALPTGVDNPQGSLKNLARFSPPGPDMQTLWDCGGDSHRLPCAW